MSKELPGAFIATSQFGCCGYHKNTFGVGNFSLTAGRSGPYPWVDIGHIYFSAPTQEQLLDAQTSPFGSEGARAFSDIHRRLSFEQARLVSDIVLRTLKEKFVDGIPADDEINAWRAANGFHF